VTSSEAEFGQLVSLSTGTSEYPMLKYTDPVGATVTVLGAIDVKLYVPPRTTLVGRAEPDELRSCSPG
jgi:hypothetical protein